MRCWNGIAAFLVAGPLPFLTGCELGLFTNPRRMVSCCCGLSFDRVGNAPRVSDIGRDTRCVAHAARRFSMESRLFMDSPG